MRGVIFSCDRWLLIYSPSRRAGWGLITGRRQVWDTGFKGLHRYRSRKRPNDSADDPKLLGNPSSRLYNSRSEEVRYKQGAHIYELARLHRR